MRYIINNFGSTTNLSNIINYFKENEKIYMKDETLYKYVKILEDAKIIYKCNRFDLRSKKSLRNEQKYYLADLSIYFATNIDARINYGPVLENIMYVYMLSKGYDLSIGKTGTLECDFIAKKNRIYSYIQVAMSISDDDVFKREMEVFKKINDNYPKALFTMDIINQDIEGIKNYNIVDFILNDREVI